ncbi:DUF2167 domain-containing protein [Lysobacter sp. A421]
MKLRSVLLAALALAATVVFQAQGAAEENPIGELPWQLGPAKATIANRATIALPDRYAFLGAGDTRKLNVLLENPASGVDEYTIAPDDLSWIAFFNFSETGYIEDNESLDPDEILISIREGTKHGNIERRKNGWDTMQILGWSFKPQYDEQLKTLEWAVLAEMEGSGNQIVNYNTRLLGRRGVMEVVLVASPDDLHASIAEFKQLLPGYHYNAGERYAEYQPGDRVAAYGLAALITGGAAAVASKKGFFAAIAVFLAKAWKLVIVAFIGIGAALRKIFAGKSDKQS